MRKFFAALTLCLVSVSYIFAQIGDLTPKEKTLEIKRALKNVSIVRDKTDNTYCLMIQSDNPYEEKYALLLLGTGEQESLNSLVNLNRAIQTPDQSFDVQNYTISTFETIGEHKRYALVNKSGQLEFSAGSYIFDEEGLGNAMLILIDRIEDFDWSNAIVTTKDVWGDAKSPTGITHIWCDIYIPQINIHYGDVIHKFNSRTDAKTTTKLLSGLTIKGEPWSKEQFKLVVNGLDNNLIKTPRSFFEKICRVKAQ